MQCIMGFLAQALSSVSLSGGITVYDADISHVNQTAEGKFGPLGRKHKTLNTVCDLLVAMPTPVVTRESVCKVPLKKNFSGSKSSFCVEAPHSLCRTVETVCVPMICWWTRTESQPDMNNYQVSSGLWFFVDYVAWKMLCAGDGKLSTSDQMRFTTVFNINLINKQLTLCQHWPCNPNTRSDVFPYSSVTISQSNKPACQPSLWKKNWPYN